MKNNQTKMKYRNFLLIGFFTILSGCILGPTIASYDQYAYSQTTALKVDVLNLMDSATMEYQSKIKSITALNTNLQKLYSYDKNRPKNQITSKQWQILLDTNRYLYGGFIKRWRTEGKLGRFFINDEKKIIDSAFDKIAQLESKKIKQNNQ